MNRCEALAEQLSNTNCGAQQEIQQIRDSLNIFRASLSGLWDLHPYLNQESLEKLAIFTKSYGYCPGTKFFLSEGDKVDPELDRNLYKALANYIGPQATLTSAYRPYASGSQHSHKKAVDIRWDENGKLMARWLITDMGKAWIEENNLTVYFEKIHDPEFRRGLFKQFIFDNSKATGPHIHVAVNNV